MPPSDTHSQHGSQAANLQNELIARQRDLAEAEADMNRLQSYSPKATAWEPPQGFGEEYELAVQRYDAAQAKIKDVNERIATFKLFHPEHATPKSRKTLRREALHKAMKAAHDKHVKETNTPLYPARGIPMQPYYYGK